MATIVCFAGCHSERPQISVEEAPYRTIDGQRLEVRADLMQHLSFLKVEQTDLSGLITGVGSLAFPPGEYAALRIPFDGLVEAVHVDAGQDVKAGDLLATIRSPELAKTRAEIARLNSEYESETKSLSRVLEVSTGGAVPERQIMERKARVAGLDSQRKGLLLGLAALGLTEEQDSSLLELRAPRSGQVILRKLDPGELVDDPENTPAFVIANASKLIARANFPERDAPYLQKGLRCHITIPSVSEAALEGKVYSVVPAIDPDTRTVHIACEFDVPDPRLRAEMLARVTVDILGPPTLLVPRSAVVLRRDSRVVLVRVGERVLERRKIVVGAYIDSKIEVVSGLNPGEEVVSEGAVLLDGELDKVL